jgi:hypothetical protein
MHSGYAIQSEDRIMRTVLEEPAPRTEARSTLQELTTKYAIPTAPAEAVGISNSGRDPGTELRDDVKSSAFGPPVHSVSTVTGRLPATEGLDDDSDRLPSKDKHAHG